MTNTITVTFDVPVVGKRKVKGEQGYVMGRGARYLEENGWRRVGRYKGDTVMLPPPFTLPGTINVGSTIMAHVEVPSDDYIRAKLSDRDPVNGDVWNEKPRNEAGVTYSGISFQRTNEPDQIRFVLDDTPYSRIVTKYPENEKVEVA